VDFLFDETKLGDLAGKDFVIVRENEVAFDVIKMITNAHAAMAFVIAVIANMAS